FVPVSWARSASTLVAALKPDVPEREDRFLYNLGAVCDLSQSAWSHKLRGWHTCETFGSWSSSSDAVLRFDIRPLPVEDLMVVAKLRSLDESSHSASVTLLANGHEVIKWDA